MFQTKRIDKARVSHRRELLINSAARCPKLRLSRSSLILDPKLNFGVMVLSVFESIRSDTLYCR